MSAGKAISIILGLILVVLGGMPLLNQFNVLSFSLPALPGLVLWIIFILGGVWLLVNGFREGSLNPGAMWSSIILGLLILVMGLMPVLNQFGIITFVLPSIAAIITDIIIVLAGILLLIGAFVANWF